jgi:cell division protein ZapA
MPHVSVTIAGRVYRMACDDGQEAHLAALAHDLDRRVAELRGSFGEIGDMRLAVMAALTVSDELAEARRRIQALEAELDGAREDRSALDARMATAEGEAARMLVRAAERIERLSRDLAQPAPDR